MQGVQNNQAILVCQKCFRFGPVNNMVPEQCFHMYFDFKYKVKTFHLEPRQLQNDAIGTELDLEYLQRAGLIRVVSEPIESDPSIQGAPARLIHCAVVRGY